MALTEQKTIDLIEIVENGTVQVREKTTILRDGEEISNTYHRWSLFPGQDYSNEPDKVRSFCEVAHTPEVIQKYKETVLDKMELNN